MLVFISFDAASRPLLDWMIQAGRLPRCAELFRRGTTFPMSTSPIHASIYRSLYTGHNLSTHGIHYPLQWCASEQRIVPAAGLNVDESVFARIDRQGRRMLIIDPPECGRFTPASGLAMSGWQFTTRFVMPKWFSSEAMGHQLERQFGASKACNEVFGHPTSAYLHQLRAVLLEAPDRLVNATLACLNRADFDFVWVTFVAAHIAGHQLWRDSIDAQPVGRERMPEALAEIYERIDRALGRLLDALPPAADIVLFSANGMGPETSRADLLPAMLRRILSNDRSDPSGSTSSPAWRIRAAVPTALRARVADVLSDRTALRLSAYLESAGQDWTRTRAFAVPSDGAGFVRLNLKGRERDGIVRPDEAEALANEIATGLRTFEDESGEAVVSSVLKPANLDAAGPQSHVLPDLVVVWNENPVSVGCRTISSRKFGDVQRIGVGSGRAGNHPGATWATVLPVTSGIRPPDSHPVGAVDLAATVCAAMQVPHDDLPGRSLLEPVPVSDASS